MTRRAEFLLPPRTGLQRRNESMYTASSRTVRRYDPEKTGSKSISLGKSIRLNAFAE